MLVRLRQDEDCRLKEADEVRMSFVCVEVVGVMVIVSEEGMVIVVVRSESV
jgi:hypothetical protein